MSLRRDLQEFFGRTEVARVRDNSDAAGMARQQRRGSWQSAGGGRLHRTDGRRGGRARRVLQGVGPRPYPRRAAAVLARRTVPGFRSGPRSQISRKHLARGAAPEVLRNYSMEYITSIVPETVAALGTEEGDTWNARNPRPDERRDGRWLVGM